MGEFSRQEYWSGLPLPPPGDLNPGIEPRSPTLQADSLPSKPPGKPKRDPVMQAEATAGEGPVRHQGKVMVKYDHKELQKHLNVEQWIQEQLEDCQEEEIPELEIDVDELDMESNDTWAARVKELLNTGVGCHSLLQGIFLTLGSNPHLHWQADSLPLCHLGSPPHLCRNPLQISKPQTNPN
uniref:Protein phosphatase 1 regulatory subunit 14 n=1 Tax=Moschus moschiferus TaxID=68415 RepID=A0A8C6EEG9_MOSMO